ncbi:hypothetical protein BT96DRAFT_69465 [Gymnopus androsaceus JB14]|uniref:Uncharacterized protein n=1 Tax=Gymnopus androsaceus JB14 TaxID=1447944 RepID=A0A6A4HKI4_9AGAR|nr:hypothetical protein BT96DRAFT_69465 [Gymnopus androsaceus JB14]
MLFIYVGDSRLLPQVSAKVDDAIQSTQPLRRMLDQVCYGFLSLLVLISEPVSVSTLRPASSGVASIPRRTFLDPMLLAYRFRATSLLLCSVRRMTKIQDSSCCVFGMPLLLLR